MAKLRRIIIKIASNLLPFKIAVRLSQFFLVSQGIGFAIEVQDSGEIKSLKKIIKKQNPIIFDVGGNVGNFSIEVMKKFPQAKIHVFEPSLEHFSILANNLEKFGTSCVLNNFGLSEKSEHKFLNKDSAVTGSATLCDNDNLDGYEISENVELIGGFDYMKKNSIERIDYLKIDVEGWELPVLRGFQEAINDKLINNIQFEVTLNTLLRKDSFIDFFNFFTKRGYSLHLIKTNGNLKNVSKSDEVFFKTYSSTNYLAKMS